MIQRIDDFLWLLCLIAIAFPFIIAYYVYDYVKQLKEENKSLKSTDIGRLQQQNEQLLQKLSDQHRQIIQLQNKLNSK